MQNHFSRPPVVVELDHRSLGLSPGVQRLKAFEYAQFVSATSVLERAQAESHELSQQATLALAQARQEGLRQGRAEARAEWINALIQMRSQLSDWVMQTEPRLQDIVLRCVHEIVRGTDCSLLVRDSVRRALQALSSATDVRIQVHESEVESLRSEVSAMMREHDLRGELRIDAMPGLVPGDCIVESPLGIVDLRVESQLKRVQQALDPS